jgi:exopolyphosphatase/guanosine-5'-triphosphate,3'-diphosphate pyrophosphatase
MPGFSRKEQARLSLLTLAHRGKLDKLQGLTVAQEDIPLIMALRMAAMFYRNRSDIELPAMQGRFVGAKFFFVLASGWLGQNPLTDAVLQEEVKQWKELGVNLQVTEG